MPVAVKAKVTEAEHRLFRNATIGMMKELLDKLETPESDAIRHNPIFLFGEPEEPSIGDFSLCSLNCLTSSDTELWGVSNGDLELASPGPHADKIPVSLPPAPASSAGKNYFWNSASAPAHGKELGEKDKKKEIEQSEVNDKQLEMITKGVSMFSGSEDE